MILKPLVHVLTYLFIAPGQQFQGLTLIQAAASGRFQFSQAVYSSTEAFGVVSIAIQRGLGSDGRVAVYVSTIPGAGNAVADQDYKPLYNVSLVWQDGDDFDKELYIPIYNDGKPQEDLITFVLTLHDAIAAEINVDRNQAQVELLPPSNLVPGTFSFQDAAVNVREGETLTVPVLWTDGTTSTASVKFEIVCKSACLPMDFVVITPLSQLLEWKRDDSSAIVSSQKQNIVLKVLSDDLYEQAENFVIRLVGVEPREKDINGIRAIGDIAEIVVTISGPNDARPGSLQFDADCYPDCASTKYSMVAGGAVLVTVQRRSGSDGDCFVIVATQDDSAVADLDYEPLEQELFWKNGDSSDRQVIVTSLARADPSLRSRRLLLLLLANKGAVISKPHASTSFVDISNPRNVYRGDINFVTSESLKPELSHSDLNLLKRASRNRTSYLQPCPSLVVTDPGLLPVALQRNYAAFFVPAQVTVKTVAGTATPGVDFEPLMTALTWANGDSTMKEVLLTILIPPSYDPYPRTFWLQLSDMTGAKVGECNDLQVVLKGIAQGPHLVSFDLNMALGTMTLYMNVPVQASTLDVTKLLLHSELDSKNGWTFRFTAQQTTTRSTDGTFIALNIGAADLNSLKGIAGFATSARSIFLSTKSGLFQYVLDNCQGTGNFACSPLLTPTSAVLTVSVFTPDTLPPVLLGYSLDLPQRLLKLHFSEAVNFTTVQIGALTLAETPAGIDAYRLTSAATRLYMPQQDPLSSDGTQLPVDMTFLTLEIGQTDVTALRAFGAGQIGIARANTFLGITRAFVADFAGNGVKAVGVSGNMLQASAADCSTCRPGFFLIRSCSDLTDRTCAPCSVCPFNSYALETCSASQDTVCYPCTECRSSHYVSVACSPTTDRLCAPCTQCTLDEFEVSPCMAGVNRVCRTCDSCKLNAAQRTMCQHSPMWKRLQMRSPFSCPRPVQEFQSREHQLQRGKSNRCGSGRCSCTSTGIAGNLNPFGNGFPKDRRCTGPDAYNILV